VGDQHGAGVPRGEEGLRRILVGGVVVIAVFVMVFRQRIFLRDPLGKVERNGIAQEDARVFINYSNDVLVEDTATHRFVMVQGWNGGLPGVPQRLACVTGMACWTDGDQASVFSLGGGARAGAMSSKEVTFADEGRVGVKVTLR
jgi:hypothetical protein